MLDEEGGHVEPAADRRERSEDHEVAVAPDERSFPVLLQDVGPRHREVRPPRGEDETDPGDRDHGRRDRPACRPVHDGGVTASPGLYLIGLPFLRRRKSTLIDGAAPDARELVEHLVTHLDTLAHRRAS